MLIFYEVQSIFNILFQFRKNYNIGTFNKCKCKVLTMVENFNKFYSIEYH